MVRCTPSLKGTSILLGEINLHLSKHAHREPLFTLSEWCQQIAVWRGRRRRPSTLDYMGSAPASCFPFLSFSPLVAVNNAEIALAIKEG